MNGLVFHIVSGESFFTGIVLLLISMIASNVGKPLLHRIAVLALLIGIVAITISSTPIPYWSYAIAAIVTVVWIVCWSRSKWRRWTSILFAATWIVLAMIEVPYHISPSLSPAPARAITIIGDSVTAGVGGDEKSETWPKLLARQHDLIVQDISHMGDTAASALKRVQTEGIRSSVVFVEIGGNDLLGSTTSSQFRQDLDSLLATIATPGRQVIMFELPLPPFCNEYGRIQRQLSVKHNVKLVPKREFLSVVAGGDSTLDSIHLSQSGHQEMAGRVWGLIRSAFPENPGK